MKHFFVLSSLFLSSLSFAQVDYSQCQTGMGMFGGPGSSRMDLSTPMGMQNNPNVKTLPLADGQQEITYTFKSQALSKKGKPQEHQYKVLKNKLGHVVWVSTAQEKMSDDAIKFHKEMTLNSAVYSGIPWGGMTFDPIVDTDPGKGEFAPNRFKKLSELSKGEAKKLNLDLDKLKEVKKASRKDQKSLNAIRAGYEKVLKDSPTLIQNGNEAHFEIENGVCKLKQVKHIVYDAQSKKNHTLGITDRESCEKQFEIQKKYQAKLDECRETEFKMMQEMNGGMNGGIAGGYVGGVAGGGMAGGVGSGGGYGYPSGGFGGYGMPGMGGIGGPQCQMYFGAQFNPYSQGGFDFGLGGSTSGSSSGSGSVPKNKARNQ